VSGIVFGAVLILIVFLMPEGVVGVLGRVLRRFVRVVPSSSSPSSAQKRDTP
jgi:branched-chain amino acid transport system permease protein